MADRNGRWERIATAGILTWFAARVAWLAARVPHAIPPDEIFHFELAQRFSGAFAVPAGTTDPYLYPFLMGRLLALNPGLDPLLLLRCANGLLAFAAVLYALRTVRRFTASPLTRTVFGVCVTNTLMFTFLAASVSYDNLVVLLAAMAFHHLLAFLDAGRLRDLLGLLASLLAGALTKTAFVPLAALLGIVLLVRGRGRLTRLAATRSAPSAVGAALCAACLLLLVANLHLYGGSWLHFGSPVPACSTVRSLEECMANPTFARTRIVNLYRLGELSWPDALRSAGRIEDPRLRQDTLFLLRRQRAWQAAGEPAMGRVRYAFVWIDFMLGRSYGVMGHRSVLKTGPALLPYVGLLFIAALTLARRWRPGDGGGHDGTAGFVTFAYALILMLLVNYPVYATTGSVTLAVQGRYLFPVLVPGYALLLRGLLEYARPRAKLALAALTLAVFLSGDLPWLLWRAPVDWFAGPG